MPRLILSTGSLSDPSRTIELTKEPVTIGRDATNTVALEGESKASRRHCQVSPVPGGYEVVDNDSTNGTRVNGSPIEKRRLNHGDVIEVGLTKIRFEDEAAVASGAASACYLEWTSGDRKGERIPLTGARTTFGRRPTSTVPLADKMASGDHAAIVKDINGYTIQDLGSTNGTLVNGEPVTEMALAHGARVRIGNSKFVFKDPAMADIQVALESVEEDDGGWGMMADLDVSRAKGGGLGVVAAIVLILALGAGAFFLGSRTDEAETAAAGQSNLVADAAFSSEDALLWIVDEPSPAVAERSEKGGRSGGGPCLSVRHDGKGAGVGFARYADDLEISEATAYSVSAWMKREGSGRAALAMQWSRNSSAASGASAVTQTLGVDPQGAPGGWKQVSGVVRRPSWARTARLVVVVPPDSSVKLDDVRLVSSGVAAPLEHLEAKGPEATAGATGGLDLVKTATALFVGATPWARLESGKVVGGSDGFRAEGAPSAIDGGITIKGKLLQDDGGETPATIEWTKTDDGLKAAVTVKGAKETGLSADFVLAHLADGLGVQGSFGARKLPAQPDAKLDGVTRVLLGNPKAEELVEVFEEKVAATAPGGADSVERRTRKVGVRPPTLLGFDLGGARSTHLATFAPLDAGLLRVVISSDGESLETRLLCNFDAQSQRANQELRAAEALLVSAPGDGLRALDAVAQNFPFDEAVRDRAVKDATARRAKAKADLDALLEARDRFLVFGDAASLRDAEGQMAALAAQFPSPASAPAGAPAVAMSQLETSVRDLQALVVADRARFDLQRAGGEVRRLARLAEMLENEAPASKDDPDSKAIALAYYDAIVLRYGTLADAAGGAAPGSADAEVVEKIREARNRRDALAKDPQVASRFPKPN